MKKSTATISFRWFLRKARQVGEGGFRRQTMYFSTGDFATSIPVFSNFPTMRGAPQNGFADDIRQIKSRISRGAAGRPGFRHRLNFAQCSRNFLVIWTKKGVRLAPLRSWSLPRHPARGGVGRIHSEPRSRRRCETELPPEEQDEWRRKLRCASRRRGPRVVDTTRPLAPRSPTVPHRRFATIGRAHACECAANAFPRGCSAGSAQGTSETHTARRSLLSAGARGDN